MGKKYSREFKFEAVSLALSSDKPNRHIARDLGVNEKTFNSWRVQAMKSPKDADKPKLKKKDYQALERENLTMKKELDLRQKEIEFLKKAAAYFAKSPKWGMPWLREQGVAYQPVDLLNC